VTAADPTAQTTPAVTRAETASASYRSVLANRRLAAFVAGDAISKLGDGMTFVALPVLASSSTARCRRHSPSHS
jgi:hypothetical protein